MRTLTQILASDPQNRTPLENAVQAAFWAGEESMRGRIVRAIQDQSTKVQYGRYHHEQRAAVNTSLAVGLLGGEGRDDSAEFLSWDFEV